MITYNVKCHIVISDFFYTMEVGARFRPQTRVHSHGHILGMVTDGRAWQNAAILLQQLADVGNSIPAVVFNTTTLLPAAVLSLKALGAELVSLPPMPIPRAFAPFLKTSKLAAYNKLSLWSMLQFRGIVYLDTDVLLLRNIDEMAHFPADTFSPEVCPRGCDAIAAGLNSGVMVLRPSAKRAAALRTFIEDSASHMDELVRDFTDAGQGRYRRRATVLLTYPEQSILREFHANASSAGLKHAPHTACMLNCPPQQSQLESPTPTHVVWL